MKKEYVFLDSFVSISIKNFLKEKKIMDTKCVKIKLKSIEGKNADTNVCSSCYDKFIDSLAEIIINYYSNNTKEEVK